MVATRVQPASSFRSRAILKSIDDHGQLMSIASLKISEVLKRIQMNLAYICTLGIIGPRIGRIGAKETNAGFFQNISVVLTWLSRYSHEAIVGDSGSVPPSPGMGGLRLQLEASIRVVEQRGWRVNEGHWTPGQCPSQRLRASGKSPN